MSNGIYSKRVKDVMSRDLVSIEAGATVHEALQLMAENRVSVLPVVDKRGHCIGVFSTTDMVAVTRDIDDELAHVDLVDEPSGRWLLGQLADSLGLEKIDGLMSEDVTTVGPDTLLSEAAGQMLRNRVHRLPVVDKSERLLAIISTVDILEALVDGAPS